MALIELSHVSKTYGKGETAFRALRDVTLSIDQAEKVAIIGRSGSGKSTLLHILAGIDTVTDGSYCFMGQAMRGISQNQAADLRNTHFGIVVQQFALIKEYTVVENVELPLLYRGVPKRQARKKALAMLERVGLHRFEKRRPYELSGGQQQRVGIARALVNEPEVLLADEPTGALDQTTAAEILALFDEIHRSGLCLIIVTHDLEVAHSCQRIIQIADGQVVTP